MSEALGEQGGRREGKGRWRVHATWVGVVVLGVAGVVVYDGVRRENTGAAVLAVSGAAGPTTRGGRERDVMRVATFNIASGTGVDGVKDLNRTVRAIREVGGADVVGLQEVRGMVLGGVRSQVEPIAEGVGMAAGFSASERRWWHDDFGNALLTAVPVESVVRLPLPQTQERGQRNATLARVRFGGRVVNVMVTHIDRRVDQAAQLRFVAAVFASLEAPAVLMGDMNVTRDHPVFRELVEKWGTVDATAGFGEAGFAGATSAGAGDARRIDLIFAKGMVPVGAGMVNIGASDHPLVWADLRLGAP